MGVTNKMYNLHIFIKKNLGTFFDAKVVEKSAIL